MDYLIPRYLNIAVSICERIASEDIPEGSKLNGRSILSTRYGVSTETIRRALHLLSDKNVVKIFNGKESVVLSKQKAIDFLKSFDKDSVIHNLRLSLSEAYDKRLMIDNEINSLTEQIIDMYKYKRSDIIQPVEIQMSPDSHMIGKSIGKLEIWHNTGATIIGIIRGQDTIVSPGPYFEFSQDDKIIIVGDNNIIERFNAYMNGINN